MCGILFCMGVFGDSLKNLWDELVVPHSKRGPDYQGEKIVDLDGSDVSLRFYSSVLRIRGDTLCKQPVEYASGNILQFNGEILRSNTYPCTNFSDTQLLGQILELETNSKDISKDILPAISQIFASFEGPWSFVYYIKSRNCIVFGRDILGRRSLLIKPPSFQSEELLISQVSSRSVSGWTEIPPGYIYLLKVPRDKEDLSPLDNKLALPILLQTTPIRAQVSLIFSNETLFKKDDHPFPLNYYHSPNMRISTGNVLNTLPVTSHAKAFEICEHFLNESVKCRTETIIPPNANTARIAVLFSGGVDCMCLCAIIHRFLPHEEQIDLLNVAFAEDESSNFMAPDRLNAINGYEELCEIIPNRNWNLVNINVTRSMSLEQRNRILDLIYPCNTELDLSIAQAFWFAAGGTGISEKSGQEYTSTAKVIISGLGADELFGGYSRHKTAFEKGSWDSLLNEIQLDVNRIPTRNLGRDDRIISDRGKELRLPFLDVQFISAINSIPIQLKTDLNMKRNMGPKFLLRSFCGNVLNLKTSAVREKKAIQFGTRSASYGNFSKKVLGSTVIQI